MKTVYVLQHVHSFDEGEEDVKFIGVYTSRENAQEAIRRLGRFPGFCESPDGFSIDEYQLDKDQWIEGYVTVTSGCEEVAD